MTCFATPPTRSVVHSCQEPHPSTRDDGGLPRHNIACKRGVGGGSVGGGGGAVDRRGARPVWIGYSTGRDRRRGPSRVGRLLYRQRPKGARPVGLRCSLSDTAPRAGVRRTRSSSTRLPHVPHPPHEGCTEGGGSDEEEGARGPAATDEARSYLDLFFYTCRVNYLCLF
jgi:hypothetical protein